MPHVESVATAAPAHRLTQEEATGFAREIFAGRLPERYFGVFDAAGVRERRLAKPLQWYLEPRGWRERSEAYLDAALGLGERAASHALARAGLGPGDVDAIVYVSTTGIATPSVDARLVNRLGLREDVLRAPLWGLGCAGGAGGLNRAADIARAHPRARVLVVAVELCSLNFHLDRLDVRSLVAASLFADGAAAAVVSGDEAPDAAGPRVVAGASRLYRSTEEVMGWNVTDEGLDVVMAPEIPDIVRKEARPFLEGFLGRHDLILDEVRELVLHPGGAKVLDAFTQALDVPPERVALARSVLRDHGNMSSPTVLHVLERALVHQSLDGGERALLAALGPGFAAEATLLEGDA